MIMYGLDSKASVYTAGDLGSIPEWGRYPGEGKGYPPQSSGLENSMDCSPWGQKLVGHHGATFAFSY